MSVKRKLLLSSLIFGAAATAFVFVQVDIAVKSIQFDLRKIGESIYEAHSNNGKWPMHIADLDGTAYLRMPHRKTMLDDGVFVVVWQADLDPHPQANANRILAYDNGSMLSRLGVVWACRGDLRIERIRDQAAALKARRQ